MKTWMNYVCLIIICLILGSKSNALAEENKSQGEITKVMATGIGIDPDSAFRNALSNAVQQAVGTVVDAETLVKNEQIVKDQILTYSDGFVSEVEKIKTEKRSDGLFESSIKATVQKRKLIEKLKEYNISVTSLDGTSLFAETFTQFKGQEDAKALLEKAFGGLPIGLINPHIVEQRPQIVERTSNGAKVSWKIELSYNQDDYYNRVLPSLQNIFDQISVDKSQNYISTQGKITNNKTIYTGNWFSEYDVNFRKKYDRDRGSKNIYDLVFLNIGRNKSGDNLRWNWYVVEKDPLDNADKKLHDLSCPLRVEFIDINGSILRSEDLNIKNDYKIKTEPNIYPNSEFPFFFVHPYASSAILPFFLNGTLGNNGVYFDQFTFDYSVILTLDEMKNLKEIKCYFINK